MISEEKKAVTVRNYIHEILHLLHVYAMCTTMHKLKGRFSIDYWVRGRALKQFDHYFNCETTNANGCIAIIIK